MRQLDDITDPMGLSLNKLQEIVEDSGVLQSTGSQSVIHDLTPEKQPTALGRVIYFTCFPRCTSGKEHTCQCRRHKRCRFNSWVRKIPWRKAWQPFPVFLPGESHGQRSMLAYSPQGQKQWDTTEATQHSTFTLLRSPVHL